LTEYEQASLERLQEIYQMQVNVYEATNLVGWFLLVILTYMIARKRK